MKSPNTYSPAYVARQEKVSKLISDRVKDHRAGRNLGPISEEELSKCLET